MPSICVFDLCSVVPFDITCSCTSVIFVVHRFGFNASVSLFIAFRHCQVLRGEADLGPYTHVRLLV